MPLIEHDLLLQTKDEDGNDVLLYTVTKPENVLGAENVSNERMAAVENMTVTHLSAAGLHVTQPLIDAIVSTIYELIQHVGNDGAYAGAHATAVKQAAWDAGVQTAAAARLLAASASDTGSLHESRIARLEDSLYSNITGNPFVVAFDDLGGVKLNKGCWNRALLRVEC